jgi:hypothetical protein
MLTDLRISHWLIVVADPVLGCLHPVKVAYFASVSEEHAASISRTSTYKVEMENLPMRCQQHSPLPHGIRTQKQFILMRMLLAGTDCLDILILIFTHTHR